MGAVRIVAALALFAGVGLAAFDHLLALTVGTSDRNEGHRLSFQEKEGLWHTFHFKYRSVTLPARANAPNFKTLRILSIYRVGSFWVLICNCLIALTFPIYMRLPWRRRAFLWQLGRVRARAALTACAKAHA